MKLPEFKNQNAQRYTGLYIIDFGDSSTVGFTAEEVAELLESEKFRDKAKVYKIYNAYPNGKMEIKGVPADLFQLECGMMFYQNKPDSSRADFNKLVSAAVKNAPPARAKIHLAKYDNDKFATVIIYPAEYNDEFSQWLMDVDYKTTGSAEGGISAVSEYYAAQPEILETHQLFSAEAIEHKTGAELLATAKQAFAR